MEGPAAARSARATGTERGALTMTRHPDPGKLLLLTVLATLPVVHGCRGGEAPPAAQGTPVVVTSIFPLGDLVRNVAGDRARVEVMLPAGASPESFEVTPRQVQTFQDASLFVMIGGGLDDWLAGVPATSERSPVVLRLTDGIELLAQEHGHLGEEGSGNPHIWLDPVLVRDRILPRLADALAALVPSAREEINARSAALADSLTAVDAEIRAALAPLSHRAFVATHPSWSYFAARYALEEVGVIHTHPGDDPSSRELARLLEDSRRHGIRCVFVEPQIGETAARALATELGVTSCMLDPLGGPGIEGREGYLALLRFNTRQFVAQLGASRP
jgi:zinc transport system substrate-binding protein